MKHLITFNESRNRPRHLYDQEELKELCSTYLVDLLDDGFKIIVDKTHRYDIFEVEIRKSPVTEFSWDSIKDRFITFLDFMSTEYIIETVNVFTTQQNMFSVKLEDMLADHEDLFFSEDNRGLVKKILTQSHHNNMYDYKNEIQVISFYIET